MSICAFVSGGSMQGGVRRRQWYLLIPEYVYLNVSSRDITTISAWPHSQGLLRVQAVITSPSWNGNVVWVLFKLPRLSLAEHDLCSWTARIVSHTFVLHMSGMACAAANVCCMMVAMAHMRMHRFWNLFTLTYNKCHPTLHVCNADSHGIGELCFVLQATFNRSCSDIASCEALCVKCYMTMSRCNLMYCCTSTTVVCTQICISTSHHGMSAHVKAMMSGLYHCPYVIKAQHIVQLC